MADNKTVNAPGRSWMTAPTGKPLLPAFDPEPFKVGERSVRFRSKGQASTATMADRENSTFRSNVVQSGDTGSESEPTMSVSRDELDAKLERSEARAEAVEAKFEAQLERAMSDVRASNVELKGLVSAIANQLQTVPRLSAMIITAATFFIATAGTIIGILAFGGDRFDGGVQLTSASVEQAYDAKRLGEQNAEQLKALTAAVNGLNAQLQAQSGIAVVPNQNPKQ